MSWSQRISEALAARQQGNLLRTRQATQPGESRLLYWQGRHYLNFSSNDYLGLSHDARVIRAWQQGADRYGVGSGGSGHVTGYGVAHQQFEEQLAAWLGYPRALLFNSGYSANQAVINTLMQKGDLIIADKLCHASIMEAAMHSPATLRRFQHNDQAALQRVSSRASGGEKLLISEGVFSMDGDTGALPMLAAAATQSGSLLMVDDAHGIGVMGEQGRGSCDAHQIKADILVVTFGKAFGVSGAALLCDSQTAQYIEQFARHLIYSTMMPHAQAVALSAALECIRHGEALRARLARNIQRFCAGFRSSSLHRLAVSGAIQPIIVGDNQRALQLEQHLRQQGIWATAIRPPTVPPGSARLRITLNATHRPDDIDRLLEVLNAWH